MLDVARDTPATPALDPCNVLGASCPIHIGNPIKAVAGDLFSSVAHHFADGAVSMLSDFAKAFDSLTRFDLSGSGVGPIYTFTFGLAGFLAAFLAIVQFTRTAVTGRGEPAATALVGLAKFVFAVMLTITVAAGLLRLADELTVSINQFAFGGQQQFADKLAGLLSYDPQLEPALLLIFAVVGIGAVLVLWLEMLFRHAAIIVLVAAAPISAAGQISSGTSEWWRKLVSSGIRLIMLKPVIALVFAVGFSLAGGSHDVQGTLAGLLVLLLAVFAWPTIATYFTWTTVGAAAGGLGAALGFAGRQASHFGGPAQGVSPDQMSAVQTGQVQRALDAHAASSTGGAGGNGLAAGGRAAGAGGGAGGGAGVGAAGAAAGVASGVGAGLAAAKIVTDKAGAMMGATAAHAGLGGAGAAATGGGGNRPVSSVPGTTGADGGSGSAAAPGLGGSAAPSSTGGVAGSGPDAAGPGGATPDPGGGGTGLPPAAAAPDGGAVAEPAPVPAGGTGPAGTGGAAAGGTGTSESAGQSVSDAAVSGPAPGPVGWTVPPLPSWPGMPEPAGAPALVGSSGSGGGGVAGWSAPPLPSWPGATAAPAPAPPPAPRPTRPAVLPESGEIA